MPIQKGPHLHEQCLKREHPPRPDVENNRSPLVHRFDSQLLGMLLLSYAWLTQHQPTAS